PEFQSFADALQRYVTETQPYRKEAAQIAEQVPGKSTPTAGAEASVRARQNTFAERLRTMVRPNARPGDLFGASADAIKRSIGAAFESSKKELLLDSLAEQNDEGEAKFQTPAVHMQLKAPRVPPLLNDVLPPLPKQLEYDFTGRTLLLRDV